MIQAGGHTIRVACWRLEQRSDLPPLLFFNGIGANIEAIAPLAEQLEERAFVTFDMPGIGRSPDPVLPYNPVTMAWATSRILDDLGIETVDVMGFSWGGALAQQFVLQHCERVRRLVLSSSFPGIFMVPGDLSVFARMILSQRFADAQYLNENMLSLYGKTTPRPGSHPNFTSRLTAPTSRGFLYQVLAMTGWNSLPFLPFVKTPTLVVTGDEDQIVPPANAEMLATAIPSAELATIHGAGHLVLLTHLDETLARLRAFLGE
ncbi:alpha/beta fold hydrolase [Erythrobacter litoralis]|uniref:alpha/beta fold hydrolase n=1 Tax=Erythrobacter litoralis TaxID=39960 RepID=UPI002435801C|nr:alpha/beta hydrolase [Erythrobacter litoralis]MDG6078345.1 alpha/beta fold hydrolase [Erythrobacter litoralis]